MNIDTIREMFEKAFPEAAYQWCDIEERYELSDGGSGSSAWYQAKWIGYQQAAKDMEPKWISVDDELPDEQKEVLISYSYKNQPCGTRISYLYEGKWMYAATSGYSITNWFPIPNEPMP